jgi:hypothetical protein
VFVQLSSKDLGHADASDHAEAELSLRIDRSVCLGRPLPEKLGLRLDAFPARRRLAERLKSCGIDRDFRKGQKPRTTRRSLAEVRD